MTDGQSNPTAILQKELKSVLLHLDPRVMRLDQGCAFICPLQPNIPHGDSEATPFRSRAHLFENGVELGPAHTPHDRIRVVGGGYFSHWNAALFFSTSDNSSPIKNSRIYHLLIPANMFAPDDKDSALGLSGEFAEMIPTQRFLLARNLYRKVWPGTPLPDANRRIDHDLDFAREFHRVCAENDVTHERKFNLDQLFKLVRDVEGDVAECGAYKGGSSFFLARHIAEGGLKKRLCLFDSFEGLSPPEVVDGDYWFTGALRGTIDDVKAALGPLGPISFVEFYKGWIPEQFSTVADRRFCFVHIDVDLYRPTFDSIAFFYPRMERGGIILLDDYGFNNCPGVNSAIDEYMAGNREPIVNLSAGGAFIMKE